MVRPVSRPGGNDEQRLSLAGDIVENRRDHYTTHTHQVVHAWLAKHPRIQQHSQPIVWTKPADEVLVSYLATEH